MREYELNSDQYPNDKLLLAAQGYAISTNYGRAIAVCEKLVMAEPENAFARRDLGFYLVAAQRYDEAASQLWKAWSLGDDLSLKMLAITYAHTKNYESLRPFVPDLLKIRETLPDANDRLQVVNVLILYSGHVQPPETGVFLKAIASLSDDLILEREDTTELVIRGLEQVGQEARAMRLRKKAEQMSRKDRVLAFIRDYENHPERFADKELLSVASAYFIVTNFSKAEILYERLSMVEADNTDAVRGLGLCYLFTRRYDEAAVQFKKGWALNDPKSYDAFADLFSQMMRFGTNVTPFASDALEIRDKVPNPDYRHKLVRALVAYSMALPSPDNKAAFLKAIDGLPDEFILENKATTQAVLKGLEACQETDRATKLRQKSKQ